MTIFNGLEFDDSQMNQINRGIKNGVDVSIYAKPDYEWAQMQQIREGLENGVDVSVFAKPEFNWSRMREIRLGLENGVDVSVYAMPEFNCYQMEQIRKGLEQNLDVSFYAKPDYEWAQMQQIREGLENGIDVSIYAKDELDGSQVKTLTLYRTVRTEQDFDGEKFYFYGGWYGEKPDYIYENEELEAMTFEIVRVVRGYTLERSKRVLATHNNNYYEITYPLDARDLTYDFKKVKIIE